MTDGFNKRDFIRQEASGYFGLVIFCKSFNIQH